MKCTSLLSIFVIFFVCNFACETSKKSIGPISDEIDLKWLQDNGIAVRSVQPDDEDYSDLEPLKTILSNAKIVMLGEQSHGDGTTFFAKTRLVKYLHKEMDFDVLAFESGMYDCRKAEMFIQNGEDVLQAFRRAVLGLWTESEQVRDLINYVNDTRNSSRPLELAGFDCQLNGNASEEYLLSDLRDFLNSVNIDTNNYSNWNTFVNVLQNLAQQIYYSSPAPSNETQTKYFETTDSLISEMKELTNVPDPAETSFWVQLLKSIREQARFFWLINWKDPNSSPKEYQNLRDIQMGENLIWLSQNYYPTKKLICWVATFHLARNIEQVTNLEDPDYYKGYRTMGQVVWESIGSSIYTLGFTAYEGIAGQVYSTQFDIGIAEEGSIEDRINRAGFEYAILDFRGAQAQSSFLVSELLCRPFGYQYRLANWTNIMDGIMYTKTMIPSTLAGGDVYFSRPIPLHKIFVN